MAHLERNRVVRRQYILLICLVLFFVIGFLPNSIQSAYAQTAAGAETVSISGTKIWVDQNGNVLPENAHPDSAELSLFANGEEIDAKTVTAADSWNWEFRDLPKFDDNGKEINYMVREASLDDYKSDMKIVVLNTYSPSKEITVTKVWNDSDNRAGMRPESVTVRLLADGVVVDGKTLVLSEDNEWSGTFTGLPVVDASANTEIKYSVNEDPVTNYSADITETQKDGFTLTNTYVNPEFMLRRFAAARPQNLLDQGENNEITETQEAEENRNYEENNGSGSEVNETPQTERNRENFGQETNQAPSREEDTGSSRRVPMGRIPESFSAVTELPGTGLTGSLSFHAKLNYEPLTMELEIPSLNVHTEIVKVPSAGGNFPVEGLGMDAGLLEGTALPGEGVSVLAAHNTLSREEYGPFALISTLEEGERIFVRDADGSMMIFEVCNNAKIDASDVSGLFAAASQYEPSLTLLTCEDELLTGGYASRRVVSARKIN